MKKLSLYLLLLTKHLETGSDDLILTSKKYSVLKQKSLAKYAA